MSSFAALKVCSRKRPQTEKGWKVDERGGKTHCRVVTILLYFFPVIIRRFFSLMSYEPAGTAQQLWTGIAWWVFGRQRKVLDFIHWEGDWNWRTPYVKGREDHAEGWALVTGMGWSPKRQQLGNARISFVDVSPLEGYCKEELGSRRGGNGARAAGWFWHKNNDLSVFLETKKLACGCIFECAHTSTGKRRMGKLIILLISCDQDLEWSCRLHPQQVPFPKAEKSRVCNLFQAFGWVQQHQKCPSGF